MRLWCTPVPIPNTMVKTQTADGTLLETARESRWMPLLKKCIIRLGMQGTSSILVIQFGFNFLHPKHMYLENYILKMIRHQTVKFKFYKHIFFLIKMTGPLL